MTLDELRALADEFFEWPDGNTQMVTLTSALLFTHHVLEISKKSLSTRNNAGMDALRDAGQQALEVLEWHLARGTWGADIEGCAANLRAALEQAEPAQEPVAWLYKGEAWFDGNRWHDKPETTTDERVAKFRDKHAQPLYTAPPPCPTAELRAVAAEREACALVAEDWNSDSADPRDIAAAIRARGTNE